MADKLHGDCASVMMMLLEETLATELLVGLKARTVFSNLTTLPTGIMMPAFFRYYREEGAELDADLTPRGRVAVAAAAAATLEGGRGL